MKIRYLRRSSLRLGGVSPSASSDSTENCNFPSSTLLAMHRTLLAMVEALVFVDTVKNSTM